jgi:transketolase N-terminal domain/subunit
MMNQKRLTEIVEKISKNAFQRIGEIVQIIDLGTITKELQRHGFTPEEVHEMVLKKAIGELDTKLSIEMFNPSSQ